VNNTWYVLLPGSLFGFLESSGLILDRAARVHPRIDPFIFFSQGHFLTPDNYRAQIDANLFDIVQSLTEEKTELSKKGFANGFVIAEVCFRSVHVVRNRQRAHEALNQIP